MDFTICRQDKRTFLIFALILLPACGGGRGPAASSGEERSKSSFEQNATYDRMSARERKEIGEVLWGYLPSSSADSDPCAFAGSFPLGGYMVFSLQHARVNIDKLRTCLDHLNAPPLLGANYEPQQDVTIIQSQRESCAADATREDATQLAKWLQQDKLNVTFAPVADVGSNPQSYVYPRVFADGYSRTADCTAEAIAGYIAAGVQPTLKHYPGHGGTTGDTHGGRIVDEASKETITGQYLLPFQAGIASGANIIMVSHIFYRDWDPRWPATLSPEILSYLRRPMSFSGIAVTDDMDMDSVEYLYPGFSVTLNNNLYAWRDVAVLLAFLHGNDLVMVGNAYRYPTIFGLFQDALDRGVNFSIGDTTVTFTAAQVCQRYKESVARINAVRARMQLPTSSSWVRRNCPP